MEIIRVSESKLKLILDSTDMKNYGITGRALSSDTATRRRALWSLLDDVKKKTGLDAAGRRTLLEAFPDKTGGYEIFVTVLEGEHGEEAALYRFSSLADLCAAVRCFDAKEQEREASLYTLGDGGYFLSLPLPAHTGTRAPTPYSFLEEYGKREKNGFFLSYIREYGTCLCANGALSYILREKENFSV